MNDRQRPPRLLTKEEDALLRTHYPNTGSAELAALMGVTVNQVNNYAKSRKLRKSAEYNEAAKARTVARLIEDRRAAKQRRLAMTAKDTATALRIQATPPGEASKTAHGTAYQSGHITTHVMR